MSGSGGVATIGVYESDLPAFLAALRDADVRRVLDVRQRRGVRDPEACHRSLIADRLSRDHGLAVIHLRP